MEIIQKSRATMVAPGYGFLSENAVSVPILTNAPSSYGKH